VRLWGERTRILKLVILLIADGQDIIGLSQMLNGNALALCLNTLGSRDSPIFFQEAVER